MAAGSRARHIGSHCARSDARRTLRTGATSGHPRSTAIPFRCGGALDLCTGTVSHRFCSHPASSATSHDSTKFLSRDPAVRVPQLAGSSLRTCPQRVHSRYQGVWSAVARYVAPGRGRRSRAIVGILALPTRVVSATRYIIQCVYNQSFLCTQLPDLRVG